MELNKLNHIANKTLLNFNTPSEKQSFEPQKPYHS
jgi:hypothetical protein